VSQHEHSEAETWLRLARKCNDTQLAEYLRTLAMDAATSFPGPKTPIILLENKSGAACRYNHK